MAQGSDFIDRLTEWAPTIVLVDLAFAIAAFWSGVVPAFVIYALAGATAVAALLVAVRTMMAIGLKTGEELGFRRNRDELAFRLLNRGIRDEAYGLGLACFLGALLSGWRPPQMLLVLGAGLLTAAWTAATRRWPNDILNSEKEKLDSGSSPE